MLGKPVETVVHDVFYDRLRYFRFFWGTTNMHWDLKNWGSAEDRTPVSHHPVTRVCCH